MSFPQFPQVVENLGEAWFPLPHERIIGHLGGSLRGSVPLGVLSHVSLTFDRLRAKPTTTQNLSNPSLSYVINTTHYIYFLIHFLLLILNSIYLIENPCYDWRGDLWKTLLILIINSLQMVQLRPRISNDFC